MLITGLCSISFRKLSVEEIIELVKVANLRSIEWGGDIHVPHGDIQTAKSVRDLTLNAGLEIHSYGSYYKAGSSEAAGLSFQSVLASAEALGAKTIRVWAGTQNYNPADTENIDTVIKDINRIATMAFDKEISISLEYHGGTLTNSNEGAYAVDKLCTHPNLFFYWQPTVGYSDELCLDAMTLLKKRITNVHVFHWNRLADGTVDRRPFLEGKARWASFLKVANEWGRPTCAYLEFAKNDSTEQFLEDAKTLLSIINEM